jgi:RHS repeat-associated protein
VTQFNSRLQPTTMGLGTNGSNLSVLQLQFGYGGTSNNGNVLSQNILFGTTNLRQDYTYDSVNRLGGAAETVVPGGAAVWSQTYGYNRFGNRWVMPGGFIPNTTLTPTSASAFDNATNRLASPNQYDNSGNHATDLLNRTFTYNGDNLQKTFDTSGNPTVAYAYDGEGHRVSRSQTGASRVFVYDAFGRLAVEYTLGVGAGGTGVTYMTADPLGSVRIATAGNGAVLARHDFLPFGEELPATGLRTAAAGYGSSDGLRHRFTGKERDNENGLDYFGARYFSGPQGRFTSVDPLHGRVGDPSSWNRYTYALNRPLILVDPDGMAVRVASPYLGYSQMTEHQQWMTRNFAAGVVKQVFNSVADPVNLSFDLATGGMEGFQLIPTPELTNSAQDLGAATTDFVGAATAVVNLAGALRGGAELGTVALRSATSMPRGGGGVVLSDGAGATAAEMSASVGGPTGGTRAGQAAARKALLDQVPAGEPYACWRCGQTSADAADMHLGHRNVPTSRGGNLSSTNVCLEGAACNLSAGNRGAPTPGMSCAERGSCGAPYQ